jgi:transposase
MTNDEKVLDNQKVLTITKPKKRKPKEIYFVGDYLQEYYDYLRDDDNPDQIGLPSRDLSYIVTLLSSKFGRKFSYQEVSGLLKSEGLVLKRV